MGALDDLTRPAGDDDTVCGVPARLVAAPASTAEASALLKEARGLRVVVRGAGTKIDWGTPPRTVDLIVDTHRLAGVREHAAGDLITVLGAGTLLDDLDLPGQQLALESPAPGATVGGTIATNVSGPRRVLYGTARDLLIGIEVVRADGTVARSGGKVVKNVAGYDLGKLFTGSYGTLGLITECAFRLHPLPAASAAVTAAAPSPAAAGRLVAAVLGAQVVASAIEVNAPPAGDVEVAVLIEGTPDGVRDRAAVLAKILDGAEGPPPAWWGAYPWQPGDVGLKLTAPLSKVPDLLAAARDTEVPLTVRGSAGSGVLYAGVPADAYMCSEQSGAEHVARAVARLREAATHAGGHAVVLTAPEQVRAAVDMWGPVGGLELMRRVKQQFDPEGRFAPGRFVGGI
ncbi:FAD-binding oxidoreductase [Actinoplanes sp. NBRC 103695]|uniref:FAD-binding oxidoreductase n=1 Tax=Actinoplanes sp. NBRC 103695 TaxID=3032202 RepID=UPI0024A17F42|nr:FAD-binding oxidoreductase [Actinoplanes sp. NBRC 103695]GLY99130.1 glycolate oxidase [Actinoplanes sp. NBRC 103695]